jgi:tetratricopeptide (TPR) repeat protein
MRLIRLIVIIIVSGFYGVHAQEIPPVDDTTEPEKTPFDDFESIKEKVSRGEMTADELASLLDLGLSLGRETEVAELAEVALGTPDSVRAEDRVIREAAERAAARRGDDVEGDRETGGRVYNEGFSQYKADARINNAAGAAYLKLGQSGAACQFLETARGLQPDFAQPYANLGLLYRLKGKYDKAVEEYDTALIYAPTDAVIWYNRGISLLRLGRIDEALDSYAKSASFDPKFRAPVKRMALVWLDLGDFNEANTYLQRWKYQLETAIEKPADAEWEELNNYIALTDKKLAVANPAPTENK